MAAITILPTTQDFGIYRGDTFVVQIRLWEDAAHTIPADLSGATLKAEIRSATDATSILDAFGLAVSTNVVTLTLTPAQAEILPARSVYDLEVDWLADRSNVQTVLRGAITADPDVTRPGSTTRRARVVA